ncbi:hypothetical protein GW17_00021475 [Ensete ventricosum]|nr:hypothetical protein GW17_00021475 [Ensete ventricosum]
MVETESPLELVRIESPLELAEHYCSSFGMAKHYCSGSGLLEHCCLGFGLAEHYCCSSSGLVEHCRSVYGLPGTSAQVLDYRARLLGFWTTMHSCSIFGLSSTVSWFLD